MLCFACKKQFASIHNLNQHLEHAGLPHKLNHLRKKKEMASAPGPSQTDARILQAPSQQEDNGGCNDEASEDNNLMDLNSNDEGESDKEVMEGKPMEQPICNVSDSFSVGLTITNQVQDENLEDSDDDSRMANNNHNPNTECSTNKDVGDDDSFCSSKDDLAPLPGEDVCRWVETEEPKEQLNNCETHSISFDVFEALAARAEAIQSQQHTFSTNEEDTTKNVIEQNTTERNVFAASNGQEIPCNYNLHQKWQTKKKQGGYVDASIAKDEQCYLELLDVLFAAKVPNYLFDKIVTWARNSASKGVFAASIPVPTRASLLKKFALYTGMEDYKPIKETIRLPNAKIDLEYVRFDPAEAVLSLMTDKYLWQPEKLDTFKLGDDGLYQGNGGVFAIPQYKGSKYDRDGLPEIPKDHVLKDFFSGHLNQMVYWKKVTVEGEELVIPMVCFMDKTHIDRHGRLCQEPFCITLGIFNRQTRADPRAWRVIGYIPNQTRHVTAKEAVKKLDDYHFILRHILAPLADSITNKGGIYWEFPGNVVDNDGKRKAGLAHFYFSCLLGDNEGHDKACNHYGNRTSKCPCLCRRCDTPFAETDNPYYPYKLLKKEKQIENYAKSKNSRTGKLICNEFGFHKLANGNAFHEASLDMGIPTHISTRLAIDLMHTLLKGLLTTLIDGFRTLERQKVLLESDLAQIGCSIEDDDDDIVLLSETDPMNKSAAAAKKAAKKSITYSQRQSGQWQKRRWQSGAFSFNNRVTVTSPAHIFPRVRCPPRSLIAMNMWGSLSYTIYLFYQPWGIRCWGQSVNRKRKLATQAMGGLALTNKPAGSKLWKSC